MAQDWFKTWFDSPYYSILYKNRNDSEARLFIANLLDYLHPSPGTSVLDLACGSGRHAKHLHESGLKVRGLDISQKRIAEAQIYSKESLNFSVHDMRVPFPLDQIEIILNLFTSFGYFDDFQENCLTLQNVHKSLVPNGIFVLDYLNLQHTLGRLVASEEKNLGKVRFEIKRKVQKDTIIKDIRVKDGNFVYNYVERVAALSSNDLFEMLTRAGFAPFAAWGDYQGNPFFAESSPRLIIMAKAIKDAKIKYPPFRPCLKRMMA